MIRRAFSHRTSVPTWAYWLLLTVIWVGFARDMTEYFTVSRPMKQCRERALVQGSAVCHVAGKTIIFRTEAEEPIDTRTIA